jgi:hypothetical protein
VTCHHAVADICCRACGQTWEGSRLRARGESPIYASRSLADMDAVGDGGASPAEISCDALAHAFAGVEGASFQPAESSRVYDCARRGGYVFSVKVDDDGAIAAFFLGKRYPRLTPQMTYQLFLLFERTVGRLAAEADQIVSSTSSA